MLLLSFSSMITSSVIINEFANKLIDNNYGTFDWFTKKREQNGCYTGCINLYQNTLYQKYNGNKQEIAKHYIQNATIFTALNEQLPENKVLFIEKEKADKIRNWHAYFFSFGRDAQISEPTISIAVVILSMYKTEKIDASLFNKYYQQNVQRVQDTIQAFNQETYESKESDDDTYNKALSSILHDDYKILHKKNYVKLQIDTLNKEINIYRFVTAGIVSTVVIMVSLSLYGYKNSRK